MAAQQDDPWQISENGCHVALTDAHLDASAAMNLVRNPAAGAIVLFAGKLSSPSLLPPPASSFFSLTQLTRNH